MNANSIYTRGRYIRKRINPENVFKQIMTLQHVYVSERFNRNIKFNRDVISMGLGINVMAKDKIVPKRFR